MVGGSAASRAVRRFPANYMDELFHMSKKKAPKLWRICFEMEGRSQRRALRKYRKHNSRKDRS